jgi:hypothetical protein
MDVVNYLKQMNIHPEAKPQGDARNKGKGYFGELKRPDGAVSTELSSSEVVDGKAIEYPLIVPTLTQQEIQLLLSGGQPTPEIYEKARRHAFERMKRGLSPFAQQAEWGKSVVR